MGEGEQKLGTMCRPGPLWLPPGSTELETAREFPTASSGEGDAADARNRCSHSDVHSAATSAESLHVRCFVPSALMLSLRVLTPNALAWFIRSSLRKAAKSGAGVPPGNGYSRSRTVRLRKDNGGRASGSLLLLNRKVPDKVWRSSSGNLFKRHSRQVKESNGTTQVREAVPMEGTVASRARKKHPRPASPRRLSSNEISRACMRRSMPAHVDSS